MAWRVSLSAIAVFAGTLVCAQTHYTRVNALPTGGAHDLYLYNESWQVDNDWGGIGLPHAFYYANASSQPPAGTRRQRCAFERIEEGPYGYPGVHLDWYTFDPQPVLQDGQYPYAPPGEYYASPVFGPGGAGSPRGFDFVGEFAGFTSPPSASSPSWTVQAVYFSDQRCFQAGAEYGLARYLAVHIDENPGAPLPDAFPTQDQPADSITFYYSRFTNCNGDFACWDSQGHVVLQNTAIATITGIPPNSRGTYEYRFRVIRADGHFAISLIDALSQDPDSELPVSGCAGVSWAIETADRTGYEEIGSAPGPVCQFSIPMASWFRGVSTASGSMTVATQTSRFADPPKNVYDGVLNARLVEILYR